MSARWAQAAKQPSSQTAIEYEYEYRFAEYEYEE
jgi:hypothetical protein